MLVRFYVGTGNVYSQGQLEEAIKVANQTAVDKFGGFTLFKSIGGWKNEGSTHLEDSLVYEIATEEDELTLGWSTTAWFAGYLKGAFQQESVLVVRIPTDIQYEVH